jgi:hypothetical protein
MTKQLDCRPMYRELEAEYERLRRRLLERSAEDPRPRPDESPPAGLDPRAIALCRENWTRRMQQEHQSAAVFTGLLPDVMAAGLGIDLQMLVVRAAMDELHHAALCSEVARYLGGTGVLGIDDAPPSPAEPDPAPALERALRGLLFVGCLSETVAVAVLTEERADIRDPVIDRVIRRIAADETLHGRLGWVVVREVWPALDADGRDRINEWLPMAFAWYEQCMLDATRIHAIPEDVLRDARALGFAHSETVRSILYDTMEHVIVPRLHELGLDARRAWEQRSAGRVCPAGLVTLLG